MAELETRGLITIEQRGNQKTNIYWIEPLEPVYGGDRQKIASCRRFRDEVD